MRKKGLSIYNLIIYLLILIGIIVSIFIFVKGRTRIVPGKVYEADKVKIDYDINKNPKNYGKVNLEKDEDGNLILILNTDIKKLNDVVSTVIKGYKNDNLGKRYNIDYKSDIYFENIISIKYLIIDRDNVDKILSATNIYYNKKEDKLLKLGDILRVNYKNIAKYKLNIDLNDVDESNFEIDNNKLILNNKTGTSKIELDFEANKMLFLAGTGFPSIFEGGELVQQQIMKVEEGKKPIAFTFDDGPLNDNHIKIRELFDKYKQQTTFFVVGKVVENNKKKLLDTYKNGHEIANHSWSHPQLTLLSPSKQADQIIDTDNIIFTLIGEDTRSFRPPYGAYNETTKSISNNIALWSIDSLDWKHRDKQSIIDKVMPYIHENGVVLFHDLYSSTYEAVAEMLPRLINEGYQFVRYDVLQEYLAQKGKK